MEGVGGEVINVETMNELKDDLAEAYRIIGEKEVEVQRLRKENAVLKKRLQTEGGAADDRERDVKLEMVERKAEKIIPKECWQLVFRHLDAEDLLSCRRVCKTFNQLLDTKEFKMKWQFKLILPHLFPYLKSRNRRGKVSWKHLSNPRLVCRSWRHSIDKYAGEVYGTSCFPTTKTSQMPLVTRLRTYGDIEEFQEKFGDWDRSPFPSGSVYIGSPREVNDDDEDFDWNDYWLQQQLEDAYNEKVGELLEQFGKHIFRLELCFHGQGCGPDDLTFCKLLKTISAHLPNLKEFIPEGGSSSREGQIASYIAENPLSPLPKLQSLWISDLDEKVKDYLLDAYCPQLTQLEIASIYSLPNHIQMQRLKNVRKLLIHVIQTYDFLEPFFRLLQSPLELLKLSCSFVTRQRLPTWNVDKLLRELLRNLKHLPIELLEIEWFLLARENFEEAGIDLDEYKNTSIKTLIIQIHPSFSCDVRISFNFLQALTKLENLEIKFCRRRFRTIHPKELPEVVKLNEYLLGEGTNRMYQSNVWEKVPSLKTLTSIIHNPGFWDEPAVNKTIIFTREEYENYERIRMIAEADVPEKK